MAFPKKDGLFVEEIFFNGFTYRRYPNSPNPAHRRYFGRAGHRLHRDVWEFHNGPIPDGMQIHHIDGNTANNDISNLECVSFEDHRAKHEEDYVQRGKSAKQIEHLAKIRSKASDWHKSEAGREWHRQNAVNSLRKEGAPKPYSKSHYTGTCEWCGTGFEAKSSKKTMCSVSCVDQKSKYMRGRSRYVHPYYSARLQSDS